ncbi:Acetate kinase [Bombilactobacillus mellifer]|uniref:Acetate kinase n=1 Tax=Bombilactobacillus mellifer TaxID=1218492 RepID=A0A0F4LTQ9_9LACO|nr:acetate kinase [Bombilactobacillus mellifer]KJY61995.1 Acetate kinase [Bombilactobacillus mellifer]
MERKVLIVNSGSSTLKFKLFLMPTEEVIAQGMVDRLGLDQSTFTMTYHGHQYQSQQNIPTHAAAVELLVNQLEKQQVINTITDLSGVGHRVVSGGPYFQDSTVIEATNLQQLDKLNEFAPLHNPAELKGIEAFAQMLPDVPQVAVFDTTFYQNLPRVNQVYSIPLEYEKKYGARHYGAHGTSHNYVSHEAARFLQQDYQKLKIISMHIGSGVSITAIQDGQAIDTSMGFTPISGVTMSSRAGDIDISLVAFLMEKLHLTNIQDMIQILNNESGLKGLSGISPDMRDLIAVKDTNPRAKLAIDVFINRIVKYVGSYLAEMNGADVFIFTAGVGENNAAIRKAILQNFAYLGVHVDDQANEQGSGERIITTSDSAITALMVPTNEELVIAREFMRLVP